MHPLCFFFALCCLQLISSAGKLLINKKKSKHLTYSYRGGVVSKLACPLGRVLQTCPSFWRTQTDRVSLCKQMHLYKWCLYWLIWITACITLDTCLLEPYRNKSVRLFKRISSEGCFEAFSLQTSTCKNIKPLFYGDTTSALGRTGYNLAKQCNGVHKMMCKWMRQGHSC